MKTIWTPDCHCTDVSFLLSEEWCSIMISQNNVLCLPWAASIAVGKTPGYKRLLLATRSETWNFFRSLYTVVVLLVGGVRKSNRTRGEWSKEGEKRIFFCECESYSFFYIYSGVYVFSSTCMFGGQNCLKEAIRTSDEAGAVVRLK